MSSPLYYGLSLSDRLNKAKITNAFSLALEAKDIGRMSNLLQSVEYSQESADATIRTFINTPKSFRT